MEEIITSKENTISYEKYSEDASWRPGGLKWNTSLKALHFNNDNVYNNYDLGSGLVTNVGVIYLADSWTGAAQSISSFQYHDCGTGSVAAVVTDTTITHPIGVPPRALGTQTNPVTAQMRSIATLTLTASQAITEWGLFSALTGGTMWDRKVFSAINAASGDSIQFTYTLSVSAGG